MRSHLLCAALGAAGLFFVGERSAEACGGCFAPPESDSVVTDHRMILSVSSQQTTLYDQIEYSGAPSSFAWVLPISGTATVGLSADVVFRVLDSQSQTQVLPPPTNCPPPPDCGQRYGAATSADASASPGDDNGGVTVTKVEVVGPYETVQLKSTDGAALNTWLTQHGYQVSADVQPIIDAYVAEHYDFLAMKLVPGASVQSMRPVRVTTQGASPVLPLRMVTAGTGPTVGITLWIVGDGRWEPQNFPFFHIETTDLVWDWGTQSSNYKSLRAQKEDALGGRGWEIESSMSAYADSIINSVQYQSNYNNNYGGGPGAAAPAQVDGGSGADGEYAPITDANGNVTKTADQVRQEDMQALFAGMSSTNVRVTRLRSDVAHAALADDLVLQASQDQSELEARRQVTREQGQPNCPIYDSQTCDVIGTAPRDQAQARSGGSGGGFWSCAVTPEHGVANGAAFASMLGFVAFGAARVTRRRRSRRRAS